MGSKKRLSSSAEGEEVIGEPEKPSIDDEVIVEYRAKKILKKERESESVTEMENGFNDPSTSNIISKENPVQPMERKKFRKAHDKERHRAEAEAEAEGDKPKQMNVELKDNCAVEASSASGVTNVLPGFHIVVFKDLASADANIRKAAAEVLVTELLEGQKAYDKHENKEAVEASLKLEAYKDDGLDNCAPAVRYAVRRLIRGVSSSRECARQGFALGLTLLVGAIPKIKVDSLLKLIANLLETTSSMKGEEARDCLLGRLFAYGALARSGRLTEDWNLKENPTAIKEFTSALISLTSKKRYLQEPAVSVLLELIEKLPVDIILAEFLEAPGVQDWFDSAIEIGNPDALLLALKVRERIGTDHKSLSKILPDYSPSKLFDADRLSSLANCLKESTFCQPRVHSIWVNLINALLPVMVSQDMDSVSSIQGTKKHKKNRKGSSHEENIERNLRSFCDTIIERSLLTSSHERKHLAFDILLLLLPKLPASCVEIVLSYKLIQCLMDILSTEDSWLYKMAHHFLKELLEWAKNDDVRRVVVIIALQKHSSGKFDCITRTKTVKNLLSEFKTESGCTLFVQSLISMFLDEGQASEEPSDQSQTTDDNSDVGSIEDRDFVGPAGFTDFLKTWVVKSLQSVLKHPILDAESRLQLQKDILKFLAVQGLFFSSLGTEVTSFELEEKFRWPKSAISSSIRRICIDQLKILLSNAQKGEICYPLSDAPDSSDLGCYFIRFLDTLCNIPSVSLFRVLSDDDDKAFKKLQAMEALLRDERNCGKSKDANTLLALRHLIIQMLLEILLRPGEFSEAAVELAIFCKRDFVSSDLLDSPGEDESTADDIPNNMDVLVDTMLSLLPQSSAPLCTAIEQVFRCLSNKITEDGLIRMLRVIKKDLKPARHHEAGTDDEGDDDDDLLGIEEAEESDEAETGRTAESDEQTDDSEAVGGMEMISTELPEASDDDDTDSGMDDDAMFKMDKYLATIFQERKSQAGGETAQSQLVVFKLRVLSLLEIYLHENPGNPQVLNVLSNLTQAIVNPHTTEGTEHLAQRIWGILQKKIFKAKDCPRDATLQLSILETLLEKNLKLASKPFKRKKSTSNTSKQQSAWNRHKMINTLGQNATFWILKVIDALKFSPSELEKVLEIFKEVFMSYFDSKKGQIKYGFLKEIVKRRPWIGHNLLGFVLEKCANAKLQFRQIEALDLIPEVLKSIVRSCIADKKDPKKMLKKYLPLLCQLIKKVVLNIPQKPRRADVHKFCSKVFKIIKSTNLSSSFLKELEPEERAICKAKLGDAFLVLEKKEN